MLHFYVFFPKIYQSLAGSDPDCYVSTTNFHGEIAGDSFFFAASAFFFSESCRPSFSLTEKGEALPVFPHQKRQLLVAGGPTATPVAEKSDWEAGNTMTNEPFFWGSSSKPVLN